MKIERVRLGSLKEDPKNARRHPAKNLKAIKGSLERFGQRLPLIVRDGLVVVGNGRLQVMRELGWKMAEVVRADDLTEEEARAFGIADNRSSDLAEYDDAALAELLREFDRDLVADIGWDEKEIDRLLSLPDIDLGGGGIDEKPAMRRLAVFVPVGDKKAEGTIEEAAVSVGGHVAECTDENCNVSVRDLDPNTWARRRVQLSAQTSSGRRDRGSESQDSEGS